MTRSPSKLRAPTEKERRCAALAVAALRIALDDPQKAGRKSVCHALMSRPRRGVWLASWANLPGLTLDVRSRTYMHDLLPGWEYNLAEMRTEMLDDLEVLAQLGVRPNVATREN